jgi:hypothetical protein
MILHGLSDRARDTLLDAVLFARGGARVAYSRFGPRRLIAYTLRNPALGEVEHVAARGRMGIASSQALNNCPAVWMPPLTLTALTQVIAYAWPPPHYAGQSWSSVGSGTGDSVGLQTYTSAGAYFLATYCGYGSDSTIRAALRIGGTLYASSYAEVAYGVGGAKPGPLVVALRWQSGGPMTLQAMNAAGVTWLRGNIVEGATPTGAVEIGNAMPFMIGATTTPDNDTGFTTPIPFAAMWSRRLSDAELSLVVRDVLRAPRVRAGIGASDTFARRLRAADGLSVSSWGMP